MKPLTENYFYGTIAAAATASATTAFLMGLAASFWNFFGPYGNSQAAVLAPFVFAFFGFILGVVPAFLILAIPLGLARSRSLYWQIGACTFAAVIFDMFGFFQLKIFFPPLIGLVVERGAVQNLGVHPVSSAWQLAAPLFAAISSGYVFHLCQGHPSRSRKALLPPVA